MINISKEDLGGVYFIGGVEYSIGGNGYYFARYRNVIDKVREEVILGIHNLVKEGTFTSEIILGVASIRDLIKMEVVYYIKND